MAQQLSHKLYRLSLTLGGLALAVASGVNAAANYYQNIQPDIALSLRSDDAVALTVREDRRLAGADVTAAQAVASAVAARRALREDAISAVALRQIGIAEAFVGHRDAAFSLLRLAHRLSRRELGTMLWLIDDSISRNDPAAMLGYVDEAFTTHSAASDLLTPALAAALFDPAVRAGIIRFVRQGRPWISEFLTVASSAEGAADRAATIVIASGRPTQLSDIDALDNRILTDLASAGSFPIAAAYLRRMAGPGADPARDIGISAATINPRLGPFGWTVIDRQDVGARWNGANAVDLHAGSDQRGTVLSRTLMLAPGDHLFSQTLAAPTVGGAASVTWQLSCLAPKTDAPLWIESFQAAPPAANYRSVIHVPAGCAGQKIELIASSDGSQADASLTVEDLHLSAPASTGTPIEQASIPARN